MITDLVKDSTIVIKVKGDKIDFNSMFVNGTQIHLTNINQIANRILWVFDPSTPNITFSQAYVTGSVLAVNSNVVFSVGYSSIEGTLIANSLNGNNSSSELHYVGHFIGKLPKNPEIPTEPSDSSSEVDSSSKSSEPDSNRRRRIR